MKKVREISWNTDLLRAYQREHELADKDLAFAAGMFPQTLTAIFQGKSQAVSFATLARLCALLGVGPGDLLLYDPSASVHTSASVQGQNIGPYPTMGGSAESLPAGHVDSYETGV